MKTIRVKKDNLNNKENTFNNNINFLKMMHAKI